MVITIENKEITLKYSFKGYMIYEQLMEESFKPTGMKEIITLFYSMCMASCKDLTITFDSFIDWLDENPKMLGDFSTWISSNITRDNELSPITDSEVKENSESSKN